MPPIPEPLTLTASDGYRLAARRWSPATPARAGIAVLGGTAIPQTFYAPFAEHAAAQGFEVMTVDYRGIGASAPATLRGFPATYDDWAMRDIPAVLTALRTAGRPLWVVGHSSAGHALGLQPPTQHPDAAWLFGTGAGWHGWMPRAEGWRVRALWHVIAPVAVAAFGHLPMRRMGLGGEDLPRGVFRQWRHWCGFPRYYFDDPAMHASGRLRDLPALRYPITAANALDDLWALPASRDAFFSGFHAAPWRGLDLDPRAHGGRLGHTGYFRRGQTRLWDDVLHWLAESSPHPDVRASRHA